jgi:hypothetical protein
MGQLGSESQPSGQTPGDGDSAQRPSERRRTLSFMGPQAETLDRLLGRTEVELGVAKSRRGWSLFSILRAAYQALSSDPNQ